MQTFILVFVVTFATAFGFSELAEPFRPLVALALEVIR